MARRLKQTTVDYVVIALSPALIMTLVGSLIFFLLAVCYRGEFQLRLHWVMACFVFGAVLIARISIEEGFERAAPFGIALALAVGVAANRFMEFHGTWIDNFSWAINWSLIGLIWWCAHQLTWDCTVIDDNQDSSGQGLLQIAGLEGSGNSAGQGGAAGPALEGTTSRQVPAGWWQRYLESQHRPHAPGVWVVYFSLAALPLFGIGQWFIPATNLSARRTVLWLLVIYVASALGLLLTTSFLGLRRYLRQRRIEMPALMSSVWLTIGAVLIVALLGFTALLPRPSAEYAVAELPFALGSPERDPSPVAPVNQEGTAGEQPGSAPDTRPSEETKSAEDAATEPSAERPEKEPPENGSDSDSAERAGGSGQPKSSSDTSSHHSAAKGGSANSKSSGGKGNQGGKGEQPSSGGSESRHESQESASDEKQPVTQREQSPPDKSRPEEPKQSSDARAPDSRSSKTDGQSQAAREQAQPDREEPLSEKLSEKSPDTAAPQTPPAEPPGGPPQIPSTNPVAELVPAVSQLGDLLKWIFYGVVAVVILYALWRSRTEVIAAIRELLAMLRDLLSGTWGTRRARTAAAEEAAASIEFPPLPFDRYIDPFAADTAGRYSIRELVNYSFQAFEAWAREHGCPRQPDQTPHELARDVARRNASMAADARNLAEMYAQTAYAGSDPPAASVEELRHLWQSMRGGLTAR